MPAWTINISPGGLLLEIPLNELEGSVLAVGSRVEVSVPVFNGRRIDTPQIEYKVEVVRVEPGDARTLVACSTVRVRMRRVAVQERALYAM